MEPCGPAIPGIPPAAAITAAPGKCPIYQSPECYAKGIAERFTTGYPNGFEHHYWRPHSLDAPRKLKTPAGIFVGSMADLFGHWVPEEQICQFAEYNE